MYNFVFCDNYNKQPSRGNEQVRGPNLSIILRELFDDILTLFCHKIA